MTDHYQTLLVDLQEDEVLEETERRLEEGEDPLEIVDDIREAATTVGDRFEDGTYFTSDLMMMGQILEQVLDIVGPELEEELSVEGSVVIGTVNGDIHDIGKNLAAAMLRANGFEVVDLGVEVPKEHFVDAIQTEQPDVVGMSGLLTQAHDEMKATVEAIEAADLRDEVKIIIGGGTILDDSVREYVGADSYATDVANGINQIQQWVGEDQ